MPSPIRRALISVSDKTGLVEFGKFLAGSGVEILSTGGSAKALRDAGVPVTEVSDHTGFPEIMDGRVKTLHPTDTRRPAGHPRQRTSTSGDDRARHRPIDLVAVHLYPFEATVARGAGLRDLHREHRHRRSGMIRAAAQEPRFVHGRRRRRRITALGDGGD
jgi:phosphoribosylaminoimidazolecarboxamide formyltransferase/IMP cyclohydrolase